MDKQLREKIEACRPASDDLLADDMSDVARRVADDPQTRLVHQRVQQWDAALSQSMDDVIVPSGLAERILARLQAAGDAPAGTGDLLSGSVSAALEAGGSAGETQIAPDGARRNWSRRHWAGAAAAGLLAGMIVLAVGSWLAPGDDTELDVLADQWQQRLGHEWQDVARAPQDFPAPPVLLVAPNRWQWVDQFTTVPVVAYELVHAKAGQAMLYVARMTRPGLPTDPPLEPQSNTGGRAVAWWQSGSRVYVLVVDNELNYGAFVRPSRPVVADASDSIAPHFL